MPNRFSNIKQDLSRRARRVRTYLAIQDRRHKWLKYVAVAVVLFAYYGLLGDCTLWEYGKMERRKITLQHELRELREQYHKDSLKVDRLQQDPDLVERVAREQYYMHAPGEEVYLIK